MGNLEKRMSESREKYLRAQVKASKTANEGLPRNYEGGDATSKHEAFDKAPAPVVPTSAPIKSVKKGKRAKN